MSFAQAKARMRRIVHDTMRIAATYQDACMLQPVGLRVRFHTKRIMPFGDMGDGYAEVIENNDRVVFDLEELATLGVTPMKGAIVVLTDDNIVCRLTTKDEKTGPIEEIWAVAR